MVTPDVNEANPVSIVPNNFGNGRRFLTRDGQRNSLAGIGWAYREDDAVPLDQVLTLISGGGGGDMLAAVYDPTGQATDIFNIENILAGNNVATTTLIFDSGSGAQTQVGVGQVLTGSATGTASMDSTGAIYSSDNGSGGPEHRTEVQFDDLVMSVAGITRVHITSNSAAFSDGAGQNIILDPVSTLSIQVTDGIRTSTLSDRLLVFDNGITQMVISDVAINDGGLGGGIDFSGTTGDVLFPNAGNFKIGSSIIWEPGGGVLRFDGMSVFEIPTGSVYSIGGSNGFTGTGSFTNFTVEGGIITAAS